VSEHPDVLYLPVSGIFVDPLDRMVAYVRTGSGWDTRPVELGGSTHRVAIVASGLEEGDEVALVRPPGG
jgi:hypothetical protein